MMIHQNDSLGQFSSQYIVQPNKIFWPILAEVTWLSYPNGNFDISSSSSIVLFLVVLK